MLRTGILLLAVAATISIVVGATLSLHFTQNQINPCEPMEKETCEPKKLEPYVSAGCDQVIWQGSEVGLQAATKNIENPAFVWHLKDEVLSIQKDLIQVFELGEHIVWLDVIFRETNGTENKTLSASTKVIVIDSVEHISVEVAAGAKPTERIFQTKYRGNNILIEGVRINVDGIEYDKMHGCGRILVTGLSSGEHWWNATYHGEIVANGTFSVAGITELKIKGVTIAPVYHVGDVVDAKLVVQNTGTDPVNKFVVKVLIVNHKYEWMGDIAKYDYSTEYTDEIRPGQQMDLPVRARIPEKIGMVKPTGEYSITIDLVLNGIVFDSKTVNTEII